MIGVFVEGFLPPFFAREWLLSFRCLPALTIFGRGGLFFSEYEFEYFRVAFRGVVELVVPAVPLFDDGYLQSVLVDENGLLVDGRSSRVNHFLRVFLLHVLLVRRTI